MSETPKVRNLTETVLSDGWTPLRSVSFEMRRRDGRWDAQTREVFARADAAAVLPYDPERGVVLLVRQFRLPALLRGEDGDLVEACAGLLDGDPPEVCAAKEAREELGCRLASLEPAFEAYSSPGSVTEKLFCFAATYSAADRIGPGGGEEAEGEDIEVLEIALDEALVMVARGEIRDAKTIMLLQHRKLALLQGA